MDHENQDAPGRNTEDSELLAGLFDENKTGGDSCEAPAAPLETGEGRHAASPAGTSPGPDISTGRTSAVHGRLGVVSIKPAGPAQSAADEPLPAVSGTPASSSGEEELLAAKSAPHPAVNSAPGKAVKAAEPVETADEPPITYAGGEIVSHHNAPAAAAPNSVRQAAPAVATHTTAVKKRARRKETAVPSGTSFGIYLAELRERSGYTIQQLAEETKIRESYLEALEAEDYKNLPQIVYVMGYIRKLCGMYGVETDVADQLTAGLRERMQYELPEDISKTVVDHEVSEENERKLRQLVMLITGGIIVVVLALVIGGVFILLGMKNGSGGALAEPLNEEIIIKLQPEPVVKLLEMN